jgi:hypothetical protein
MTLSRRDAILAISALPIAARAATIIPAPAPTLRQASGRPLWQPVTNRNNTNGTEGTPGTAYPDTLSRITKTVQTDCSELRTVLMGFQMNPYEQPLIGNNAGVTGAYAVASVAIASAGTGYTVGDVLTMSKGAADMTAAVLIVTQLGTSGAVAAVKVADPGAYTAPLAAAAAPSTAVKRGGGNSAGASATFTFTWSEYALAAQVGIEPAGTQTGTNASAVITAGIGPHYDGLAKNSTVLVPDAGFAVTDPVGIALPKGAAYAERVATIGAPPGVQRTTMGVDYFASANTWRSGALTSTALAVGTGTATMGTVTLGLPGSAQPWFCIVGDSIDFGIVGGGGTTTDTGDAYQNSGWIERGLQLAGGYGLLSITRTGDALGSWYLTQNRRFMRLGMLSQLAGTVNFGSCIFIAGQHPGDDPVAVPGLARLQPGGTLLQHLHARRRHQHGRLRDRGQPDRQQQLRHCAQDSEHLAPRRRRGAFCREQRPHPHGAAGPRGAGRGQQWRPRRMGRGRYQ